MYSSGGVAAKRSGFAYVLISLATNPRPVHRILFVPLVAVDPTELDRPLSCLGHALCLTSSISSLRAILTRSFLSSLPLVSSHYLSQL